MKDPELHAWYLLHGNTHVGVAWHPKGYLSYMHDEQSFLDAGWFVVARRLT